MSGNTYYHYIRWNVAFISIGSPLVLHACTGRVKDHTGSIEQLHGIWH